MQLRILLSAILLAVLPPQLGAQLAGDNDPSPHSDIALISAGAAIQPGQAATVGVRITMDAGWHTYWINGGDAGLPLSVSWKLPRGVTAGPLRFPTPRLLPQRPLMSYGYEDQLIALVDIVADSAAVRSGSIVISATADWLTCADVCLPAAGEASLVIPTRVRSNAQSSAVNVANARLLQQTRDELPRVPDLRATLWVGDSVLLLAVVESAKRSLRAGTVHENATNRYAPYVFPDSAGIIDHARAQHVAYAGDTTWIAIPRSPFGIPDILQFSGLLSTNPNRHDAASWHFTADIAGASNNAAVRRRGELLVASKAATTSGGVAAAELANAGHGEIATGATDTPNMRAGSADAFQPGAAAAFGNTTANGEVSLLGAMALALLGGLLLNLMPCVFPVLSLKVLSFVERGANDPSIARKHALVFAAGVLATFWALAISLLVVRAGGASVGWGFQLQSPLMVALLSLLLFALGLNLAGVFEVGLSATRLGAIGQGDGYRDSFLTGALAVIVATPCTAPFMGVALGFALVQPPAAGLAVFTSLAFGLALPYVLLAWSPSLLRRLPRSGPWLETFKQALAFPLFATVVWLLWVFGQQTDMNAVAGLLFAMTALALGAWLLGRSRGSASRTVAMGVFVCAIGLAAITARGASANASAANGTETVSNNASTDAQWLDYSPARLDSARATGQPVLLDFTAAWCLSCQVNERVALRSESVRRELVTRNVIALRADWTNRDADIANIIASYGRSGIPLYVLYSAHDAQPPELLPAVLTPGGVVEALGRAAAVPGAPQ